MKFCSACGSPDIGLRIPIGDHVPRYVCGACATVYDQNPKVVVGCLPEWEDRVLLCKRAIEPRHGLWTLPAGFLENGEAVTAGAARETLEEAGARIEIGDLYTMGPREAAYAARMLKSRVIVPAHYGTFPPLTGTPDALREELQKLGVSAEVVALRPGETLS